MLDIKKRILNLNVSPDSKDKLTRGAYLLLFIVLYYFICSLITFISIFQLVYSLIFKQVNDKVATFSQGINRYYLEIIQFITYNSNHKPFPISSFPKENKNF